MFLRALILAPVLAALCLAACRESAGELAARMEAQDHAACVKIVAERGTTSDPQAYTSCRQNLVAYRQINEPSRTRQAEAAPNGLQGAGRALCGIGGGAGAAAAGC